MELIADPVLRANLNTILNIATFIALGIAGIVAKIRSGHLTDIKDQIANDHIDENGKPINLREELDIRDNETKNSFNAVLSAIYDVRDGQRDIREDVNIIKRRQLEQDISIDALQNTQTKQEVAEAKEHAKEERLFE